MNTVAHKQSSAPSFWLLACAALWGVGMCAWYANSYSKDGWSQTPLIWMLVLLAAPKSWVLAWTVVNVAMMVGLFLGEHAVRRILHPGLPPASLRQTGQVMLRAHFGG